MLNDKYNAKIEYRRNIQPLLKVIYREKKYACTNVNNLRWILTDSDLKKGLKLH